MQTVFFKLFLLLFFYLPFQGGKYFWFCCESTGVRGRIVTIINSEWKHFFYGEGEHNRCSISETDNLEMGSGD